MCLADRSPQDKPATLKMSGPIIKSDSNFFETNPSFGQNILPFKKVSVIKYFIIPYSYLCKFCFNP